MLLVSVAGAGASVVVVSAGGGGGSLRRGWRAGGAGTAAVVVGVGVTTGSGVAGAVVVCTGRGVVVGWPATAGVRGTVTLPVGAVIVDARLPDVVAAVVPFGSVNAVVVSTLVLVIAVVVAGGVVSPGALMVEDAPDCPSCTTSYWRCLRCRSSYLWQPATRSALAARMANRFITMIKSQPVCQCGLFVATKRTYRHG